MRAGVRLVIALTLFGLVAASCGRTDTDLQGAPADEPTPAPTPCLVEGGSTEAQRSDTAAEMALVTDVRYNAQDCPRIVFEFEERESGYAIEYTSPPFSECGSGEPIPTTGWEAGAFLSVRLEPAASADLSQEDAPQTYRGPRDIAVDGPVLKRLKVVCDFEAVFEWIVGLDTRHDFAVVTLADPSRLIIDISEVAST